MGELTALSGFAVVSVVYWVHKLFNTSYDWAILTFVVLVVCYKMDDKKLIRLWKMNKWINRQVKKK